LLAASLGDDVDLLASALHGSSVGRAERKVINLRPLNLIWVIPAQGAFS